MSNESQRSAYVVSYVKYSAITDYHVTKHKNPESLHPLISDSKYHQPDSSVSSHPNRQSETVNTKVSQKTQSSGSKIQLILNKTIQLSSSLILIFKTRYHLTRSRITIY